MSAKQVSFLSLTNPFRVLSPHFLVLTAAVLVAVFGLVARDLDAPETSSDAVSFLREAPFLREATRLRRADAVGVRQRFALLINGPLGPNDGEPLKAGEGTFTIQTGFHERGHLFVTAYQEGQFGSRFDLIRRVPVPPSDQAGGEELREIREHFDLSRYGGEELRLGFYLMNEHFSDVVAFNHWRGQLVFPRILYLPSLSTPTEFRCLIDGRQSDKEYVLVLGTVHDLEDGLLELNPGDGFDALGDESLGDLVVESGEFPRDGQKPELKLQLTLDTLFQNHGRNTVLILWTRHPELGWARSLPMQAYDEVLRANMEALPCSETADIYCDGDAR